MTTADLPTIAIYVARFPAASETFIVSKVLGLLEAGFGVQIFANQRGGDWDSFGILSAHPNMRRRVHVMPPFDSLPKIATLGVWRVLRSVLRHPFGFARLVRHCWRFRDENPLGFLKAIYLRLMFVGQRADVLHIEFDTQAHSMTDVKHYLGCKLLLSGRGTFQKTSVIDRFPDAPARIYRHTDGYHFISEYLRQNAYGLGLSRSTPTWIVSPAIDVSLFVAPNAETDTDSQVALRIVSVGRLAWQKGYEFALDAVAELHQSGLPVKYTIVGDGPYREAIHFAARQWGLLQTGVVSFAGAVPRREVVRYLAEADVMLHVAVEEGFCNAVIEGQAMQLPIVASDAGGLPENVENTVSGFIVPRRDPGAAAEKLRLLAADPDLRRRMGQAGRRRVLERFALNDQIEQFAQLYRELMAT